jgi:ADP-dependent NAD(P)H-hydrate dehydratase / NAD(P)H-hydrate epimerase
MSIANDHRCAAGLRATARREDCVATDFRAPACDDPGMDPLMPVHTADERLPVSDPRLADPSLDLDTLTACWAAYGARRPMTAEQMRGADRRAQRLGVAGRELMEQAGTAVAAAARATLNSTDRPSSGLVLILAGPGNNGGDALVAARRMAEHGIRSFVALVSADDQPGTGDARANWQRLDEVPLVQRMHAATAHDVALLLNGLERAALVVDGLLGTGVRGPLRDPIRAAVELCLRARRVGVPVLAVDTPTAVDLTSGQPSDPVVRANVTVTFHRPKEGLLTRIGAGLAGRVLVAPIGIPPASDPGA